jgi:hypothetical protein
VPAIEANIKLSSLCLKKGCKIKSRTSKAQHNHIMNVFFVYALLQIERKKLKLKNPEATIKHLKRKNYTQLLARFMQLDQNFDGAVA